jgi:hypothetical protein
MLWRLQPIKGWNPWYDCMFEIIVRAESEDRARQLANAQQGNPRTERDGWLDPAITSCERIWSDGDEEVICRDIHSA